VIRKEAKMRLVHAAALTVAALLLTSAASAQGLGAAAAREKEKRKAASAKPAKVYTETDIGTSMAPVSAQELPATADAAAAAAKKEGGEGAAAGGAPTDPEKTAEEARVKAEADWRSRLDQARKEETSYKDIIDKIQLELNDTSGGFYNAGRAAKITFRTRPRKLAAVQGRISTLEEEGRRNNYR
jgi:hypothetical protein